MSNYNKILNQFIYIYIYTLMYVYVNIRIRICITVRPKSLFFYPYIMDKLRFEQNFLSYLIKAEKKKKWLLLAEMKCQTMIEQVS